MKNTEKLYQALKERILVLDGAMGTMLQKSGLEAGELVHVIADAHIYDRHIPLVEELITREQYTAPKLWINPEVKDFYKFTVDDFKLIDYKAGEQIKNIPVAV